MNEPVASAVFAENGDTLAFGVPFSKVNVKDRTVEGFATLDNIDKAYDVVDADASKEAFDNWLGNIREMHGPKAVGTAVQIESRTLDKGGKKYSGIWVKSRISKGAEDTWQKVLDGTLKGYSIGGRILERQPEVVKGDDGRFSTTRVNRITKYQLAELSVVDNPMNPLALFDDIAKGSLIKMENDELVAGELALDTKGLFYCEQCDVAKMDASDFSEIECLTCDKNMLRIAEVTETPGVSELKKMVDAHNGALEKIDVYTITESDGEAGFGVSGEWKPDPEVIDVEVEVEEAGDAESQESDSEDTKEASEDAPQIVEETTLATQKAEGEESFFIEIKGEVKDAESFSQKVQKKILEVLKSRSESTGRSRVDKDDSESEVVSLSKVEEERAFINALLKRSFNDLETPGQVRAAIATYNAPGQRETFGYSFLEWANIGKSVAAAANVVFAVDDNKLEKGMIVGSIVSVSDKEKGEFILNLQKNSTDGNNKYDVIKLLHSLVGYEETPSIIKGGETPTVDVKELEKILDILNAATREVGEIVKGFNVQNLNSENASGPSLGGSDPGEAGVGTAQENDGGSALNAAEVEVATATSMPAPDNGPDKVVPDAIATDGVGEGTDGITADSGPEKVLPHADLASTSATTKDEGAEDTKEVSTEDLIKAVLDKVETAFASMNDRLSVVEGSGAMKKSVEVGGSDDEIKKSDEGSFWGNLFSADELQDN